VNTKIYTLQEAQEAATRYFGGDELAARVWATKYALKDSQGNIYELTPDDMHHRIAAEIARVERNYPEPLSEERLFELMEHFRYIVPQGSPMTGIGNNYQVASLSNCFVIGCEGEADSYGAIIKLDEAHADKTLDALRTVGVKLQGRLCRQPLSRGIYISNGKRIIIN
jgi:ribonucleoside-diphosphate reductase alpha chain